MRIRTTSCVSRDSDGGAGADVGAFGDEGLGEVAVAEGDGAVTEGDKEAGTFVVAYTDDFAVGYGVGGFVVGTEVDAAVEGTFVGEGIDAIAVGTGDDEGAKGANHCEAGGGVGGGRGCRVCRGYRFVYGQCVLGHCLAVCLTLRDGVELSKSGGG